MNGASRLTLLAFLVFFSRTSLFAQYILNGSAQKNDCNCYTLTQPVLNQSGSVWNSNKISLSNSFDFWFNVYLGCNDATGADGIVFMLQPISTSVGASGQGMGFSGVSPSVGITLDTWQNTVLNDPTYDHITIQANGVVAHVTDLAGPVPISAASDNVEDCQWHKLRISWDASTKWLRTYFDGVLRVEKQINLVASIFNNDPAVYWGFTGATGGSVNLQQFCTALDPVFRTNFSANVGCEGIPVVFTDASESFAPIAAYNWNFGDGTTSNLANPPPHVFPAPGDYKVTLKIKGQDGCERDSTKTVKIAGNAYASLTVADTCEMQTPRVSFSAPTSNVKLQWQLDGVPGAVNQQPSLSGLSAGSHHLEVVVTSDYGCGQPATAAADFNVKPLPVVDAVVEDGCVGERLTFDGVQTDNQTLISNWQWEWGSSGRATGKSVQTAFSQPNKYGVRLWATANNGCTSDTVSKTVSVSQAYLLVNDTTIIRNMPAKLRVQTNGDVLWQPTTGLSDATIATPLATLATDQAYFVTATTPEGCTVSNTMRVKVFTGPTVYVPSAFTPNGDGKNEVLLPVYVGMKELQQFAVFNRWGQAVFTTSDPYKGWSGNNTSGTFVWLVRAVDYLGQPVVMKGTVTVIR